MSRPHRPYHLGLAMLYRRAGKRQQSDFANATAMSREMGMTYWLERAETEISGLRG